MAGQGAVNNPVNAGPYPLRARTVKNTRPFPLPEGYVRFP
jgi:hypothetical protein